MRLLDWALLAAAVAGAASSARWYLELYRWARICQWGRIVIAHKRRVILDRPITEWIAYCNMLRGDERSNGRTVYALGGTRVAVIKPLRPPGRIRQAMSAHRRRRKGATSSPHAGGMAVRETTR